MLHDIAKPQTTSVLNDKTVSPHHSKKGATWARWALWNMGVPFAIREQVCALISYHQVPFFALSEDSMRGEYLARKLSCDVDLSLLCALAESDIKGRVCPDQQNVLDNIELFASVAKDLDCFDKPFCFPSDITRSQYVRGYGNISVETKVYEEDKFTVYMMSGLPASGKDTWALQSGLPVVSYDKERERLGKRHGKESGTVAAKVMEQAKEYLRKKQSFVWNATFLTPQMRNPVSELIRNYGGKVSVVCVEADRDDILTRNKKRNNSLRNDKLLNMAKMWEMPFAWEADSNLLVYSKISPKIKP